jgi:hypothetical protein
MWSAIGCLSFYLIKSAFIPNPIPGLWDMIFMAYGLGSIATFLLIYGFDWS